MSTHPEQRPDKNGNIVTRHIKNFIAPKNGNRAIPSPVTLGELVTCGFCSTQFNRGTKHRCKVNDLMPLTSATKSILRACVKAGGKPIIVGGSVRDSILNKVNKKENLASKDIDIEVYGTDIDTLTKFLARHGTVKETGVSFGVLKIRVGEEDFDVSLPRRDSKTGSGHKGFDVEVDHNIDEVEAFGRRDFTINALGYDPTTQELVDPYGGVQDLLDGVLRHTTKAFSEDPLRVLRGMQFAARFGFDMAPETIAESESIKDAFKDLAVERVWEEFHKMFTRGIHISKALDVLKETGWMEHFPELGRMEEVPQDPRWHPEGNVLTHLGLAADEAVKLCDNSSQYPASVHTEETRGLIVFAAMVHDFGKFGRGTQIHNHEDGSFDKITSLGHAELGGQYIESFADRIGAPKSIVQPAVTLVSQHMSHSANEGVPTSRAVRNLVRRLDAGGVESNINNWALLVEADRGGRGEDAPSNGVGWQWLEKAKDIDVTKPARLLVNGNTLKEMGLTPSPFFAEIINAARQAQDDEEFDNAESGLEWARRYVARVGIPDPVVNAKIDPRLR